MNLDEIPAIDETILNELKELVMEDGPEFLIELLGDFVSDAESGIQAMANAATTGDAEVIEQNAHRMKSSCAHLGALSMASLCENLQRKGRSGELEGTPELVASLSLEFGRVRAEIDEECRKIA
jgi:HPt (histidine-containing phosphotransfer) domain-containing protein